MIKKIIRMSCGAVILTLLPLQAVCGLTPHRAYYKVSLISANQSSGVYDVEGGMVMELRDSGDGWTVEQESSMTVYFKTNPAENVTANYSAWESKSGKELKFFARRIYNDTFHEDVNGVAKFAAGMDKGRVEFTAPEKTTLEINKETIPPMQYLSQLIQAAESGAGSLNNQVFDGSFYGDPVLINTFIGLEKPQCKMIKGKSMTDRMWPMNLAVYNLGGKQTLPNFEVSQNVLSNGIMCSYTVNFGSYTVTGVLDKIEYFAS